MPRYSGAGIGSKLPGPGVGCSPRAAEALQPGCHAGTGGTRVLAAKPWFKSGVKSLGCRKGALSARRKN